MLLRLFIAIFLMTAFQYDAASAQSAQAGFERVVMPDKTEIGIWYPTSGTSAKRRFGLFAEEVVVGGFPEAGRHPLIVISHGTGGDFAGHVDTAVALARAGFVVASLTHPGDNWRDNSRAARIQERPRGLSALITYMLSNWSGHPTIDPDRIGAFGFSSGGFTVLVAAGGQPDLTRLISHCRAHPDFFDCQLVKSQPREARTSPANWSDQRDHRIKALVVAAPALGFTFDRASLKMVRIPVQLWRADQDQILPAPYYADAVRAALPAHPEFHSVAGAGHFDFLAPCVDKSLAPELCKSLPGFDRAAFHNRFNMDVVAFFRTKLER